MGILKDPLLLKVCYYNLLFTKSPSSVGLAKSHPYSLMISLHDDKCLAFCSWTLGGGTRYTISACIMDTFTCFSVREFLTKPCN